MHATLVRLSTRFLGLSLISFVMASSAFAGTAGPRGICMANGQQLSFNNEDVLKWKTSTPNGWQGRGFVQGKMVQAYKDRSGHDHFEIQIGSGAADKIEIIYNQGFGDLPEISQGQTVVVCGDYITARDSNRGYPPSPDGAIIHWVHGAPNGRHEDGFVSVDGKVYGQSGDANRQRGGRRNFSDDDDQN